MFCIWLNVHGQFNPVFLDSYLPYNSTTMTPLFCYSQNTPELWPALVEKAIAKSLGGYDKIK
jgi:hypothetical protein